MSLTMAVVSGLLVALGVLLMQSPPVRLRSERAGSEATEDRSVLVRLRPVLAPSAGAGALVLVGGYLGVAVALTVAAVVWRSLGSGESPAVVRRRERLEADLPIAVDLMVAGLSAGAAPVSALEAVGEALGDPVAAEIAATVHRLRLGGDPGDAWRRLARHPQLGPLGRALSRAHESGASVVDAGERLATELRETRRARSEALAKSASTRAAAPLGACFLPAFVLLGVVPLVASLLSELALR